MLMDRFKTGDSPVGTGAAEPEVLAGIMAEGASDTAGLLKAMSHEGRLMILCHLAGGERSVTELEELLGQRQAAVSQQLARLRLEGLVATRRDGKAIFYSIRDPRVTPLLQFLTSLDSLAA